LTPDNVIVEEENKADRPVPMRKNRLFENRVE